MKLQFDGTFVSAEKKNSKNGKEYMEMVVQDIASKFPEKIFIFNSKLFDNIELLKAGDNVVVIFNRFYSFSEKREVFLVADVVPC